MKILHTLLTTVIFGFTMVVIAIANAPGDLPMVQPHHGPGVTAGYTCWSNGPAPVDMPDAAHVIGRDGKEHLVKDWGPAIDQALGGKKVYTRVIGFCADLDNPDLRHVASAPTSVY